ncbi:MAG TPA: hypothetical protein HPP77_10785 [Candidatus Hydrogenedentes bacterium]|nr:hypothetical protein [Candidatus Hydrogenedentota bacterium]HIJ72700.1 hypothetical protein [Candidatus Hydrogenedentota bacterium]
MREQGYCLTCRPSPARTPERSLLLPIVTRTVRATC